MIEQLETLKSKLDEHRPFPPELEARIDAVLIPKRIYLTNVFEDNTLTLEETAYYLETQRMIGGKLEREYREVKSLHQAISFVRELRRSGGSFSMPHLHSRRTRSSSAASASATGARRCGSVTAWRIFRWLWRAARSPSGAAPSISMATGGASTRWSRAIC